MASEAGADAVGFVFYEKSPRNIVPETAARIVAQLPTKIEKVGVFVNRYDDGVKQLATQIGLTAIQLHLDTTSDLAPKFKPFSDLKNYLVLRVNDYLNAEGKFDSFAMSSKDPASAFVNAIFLDSGTPQMPGGTGRPFDWVKAVPIVQVINQCGFPVVVAGGLTPANVTEAIRILKPLGVDVVSGVEATPGKKDPAKVRAFIEAVRKFDSKN